MPGLPKVCSIRTNIYPGSTDGISNIPSAQILLLPADSTFIVSQFGAADPLAPQKSLYDTGGGMLYITDTRYSDTSDNQRSVHLC